MPLSRIPTPIRSRMQKWYKEAVEARGDRDPTFRYHEVAEVDTKRSIFL